MSDILVSGTPAPDFTLAVTPDQRLSLRELRGRPVILAFYPADWSPVCRDQLALYNEVLSEFRGRGAELLGISVDAPVGINPGADGILQSLENLPK
jgi:peroxiredoxin